MKHLKSYKEIEEICKKYEIENWYIGKDGLINVDGDVNLIFKGLNKLPLNFGKIQGEFDCKDNNLISLEGAPKEVGGNFSCGFNNLTSLEGAPKEVGGNFYCLENDLTSLEGIPFNIRYLYCYDNPIYEIWEFIDDTEYLQEFIEVYDVVRPGKVVILEYLNDIRELMGVEPIRPEEIPDDWEILDV